MDHSTTSQIPSLTFSLTKDDFLEHHLFNYSGQSKGRFTGYLVWFGLPALFFYSIWKFSAESNLAILIFNGVFGIAWLAGYPFYRKWMVRKTLERTIKRYFSERLGEQLTVSLEPNGIRSKDAEGEGYMENDEVEAIVNLPNIYMMTFIDGQSLIFPKRSLKKADLKDFIQRASAQFGIEIIDQQDWSQGFPI